MMEPAGLDLKAFNKANADLRKRLVKEGVSLGYDEDTDTLLIDIGGPNDAVEEDVRPGVSLRYDLDTLKCFGATVFSLTTLNGKLLEKLFKGEFDQFKQAGGEAEWRGEDALRAMPFFEAALSGEP